MKLRYLFFMLFMAWLPSQIFSQIQVEGNLQLGDTSQVHTLFTTSGDRMVGRVTAFDNMTVSFELKNKTQLLFRHEEISKIVVQQVGEKPSDIEYLDTKSVKKSADIFAYQVSLINGKSYTGEVIRFSKTQIKMLCPDCPSRLGTTNIKEIILTSQPIHQMPQSPSSLHVLKTSRGDRFVGQLLQYVPGNNLLFLLENGDTLSVMEQKMQYGQLVLIEPPMTATEPKVDLPIEMNGQEKLMFGGTGFTVPKGQAEFRSTIVFFHSMDIGLTDFFSLGAGASTFTPFLGFSFRAKLGFNIGKYIHIGAGGMVVAIHDENNDFSDDSNSWESVAVANGALTIGTRERYVNFGIMRGNETLVDPFDNESPDGGFTGFTIGGAYRINNHFRFFAEHFQLNWKDPETPDFSSIGFSFFTLKHRLDFGISIIQYDEADDFPIIFPVAGYSLRF